MFYRVLCITLLAIACTFTVILTNVFVDIDLLLSSKDNTKAEPAPTPIENVVENKEIHVVENKQEPAEYDGDSSNGDEEEERWRKKRSIESVIKEKKNPMMKHLLTRRLASLLEELELEDATTETAVITQDPASEYSNADQTSQVEHSITSETDLLKLAMHNILLDGIINHIDLSHIYKEIHILGENFKNIALKKLNDEVVKTLEVPSETSEAVNEYAETGLQISAGNEDSDNFISNDEASNTSSETSKAPTHDKQMNDNTIRKAKNNIDEDRSNNVYNSSVTTTPQTYENNTEAIKLTTTEKSMIEDTIGTNSSIKSKGPKLMITTTIDIVSNSDTNDTINKEDIKNTIKIIYNGNLIVSNASGYWPMYLEAETKIRTLEKNITTTPYPVTNIPCTTTNESRVCNISSSIPTQPSRTNGYEVGIETDASDFLTFLQQYLTVYNNHALAHPRLAKTKKNTETKRCKRHIKVRYTNNEKNHDIVYKEKKHKKKKILDDDELFLEIKTHFSSKRVDGAKKRKLIAMLIEKIEQALHSDIDNYDLNNQKKQSKTTNHWNVRKRVQNTLEALREVPYSSRLLDPINKIDDLVNIPMDIPNNINIMKDGETDVQENSINQYSYVPQRYLAPLTTSDREIFVTNALFELRNKLIKNLAETAASIGLGNGEGPDFERLKIINAVDNLIRTYHERSFNQGLENNDFLNNEVNQFNYNENHISKRDVQNNKNSDIFSVVKSNRISRKITPKWERKVPITKQRRDSKEEIKEMKLFSKDILTKSFKPADLLTLASLLDRAKRSTPKRLTKRSKKSVPNPRSQRYFVKTYDLFEDNSEENKRNKRNIMYLDSEQEKPDEDDKFIDSDQNISTRKYANNLIKKLNNVRNSRVDSRLSMPFPPDLIIKARRNGFMSQYPHIFFHSTHGSEEYVPENFPIIEIKETTFERTTENSLKYLPNELNELIKAIASAPNSDSNINVNLKLGSSDSKDDNATRFKEVHTTIGEKYERNGISISSHFNVSQISPIDRNPNELEPVNLKPFMEMQRDAVNKLLANETEIIASQLQNLDVERNKINQLILRASENKKIPHTIKVSPVLNIIKHITTTEKNYQSDLINVSIPSTTSTKILAISREEVSKIVSSVLDVLKAVPDIVNSQIHAKVNTSIMPQTTVTIRNEQNTPSQTPQSVNIPTYENHLKKIINFNLELTNHVIKKIDKNTDMLGIFLQRLSNKIDNYEKFKSKKATGDDHKPVDEKLGKTLVFERELDKKSDDKKSEGRKSDDKKSDGRKSDDKKSSNVASKIIDRFINQNSDS